MHIKVVGCLLLFSGLFLVILSLVNVYQVFTNQADPIQLFNQQGISFDIQKLLGSNLSPALDLEASDSASQLEILSPDSLNRMLNLPFHLMFMGFVSTIGFRLSTLGQQFLRPIVVDLKTIEKQKTVS